jgi:phosphoserine aminotransferase
MISFYPGPSRIHDEIPKYVKDAAQLGIMSINHRSEEFVAISKKTIALLKQKLGIPKDFTIFFTSSATECWEIIAQSWVTDKSYHLFNGAFGQKWFDYTHRIKSGATALPFEREVQLDPATLNFEGNHGVICLTHNETSNGTQVATKSIKAIKKNNPSHLVAVDATSSMAGVVLDFTAADIWFASVQKCFGLPAGMGIMICAPKAIARAKAINNTQYYNSVVFMDAMMQNWQTPYTPNVLAIYLLMRVMEKVKPIKQVHAVTVKRYHDWIGWLQKSKTFKHLIKNKTVHSYTVLPLAGSPDLIEKIKRLAKKQGFLLGEGYGEWKPSTFRIANFPALKTTEINSLRKFLSGYQ